MTTLLEDLRVELRQMCQAVGLSGTAASVVPLVLLGIALNVVALRQSGACGSDSTLSAEAGVA